MVSEKQVKKWLKEGIITDDQAKKMLGDISEQENSIRFNKFTYILGIIGAVLIFLGFAWLIAYNWHQIPNFIKVLILVSSTLAAFVSGVIIRQKHNFFVGRSLIVLGALLYVLSLFLISQIYHLATSIQHYAWILLFAWIIILLTAYFLDSKDNLVVAMLLFFPWVITQYISSSFHHPEGPTLFGFILIFLSAGVLLFGIKIWHSSLKHKFASVYRFWVIFYFLLLFYIMSFQSVLPILSELSFELESFSVFTILFTVLSLFGFITGSFFAIKRKPDAKKEIVGFIAIFLILFALILASRIGAEQLGVCSIKRCNEFKTAEECSLAPAELQCEAGRCENLICSSILNESECTSHQKCRWSDIGCHDVLCRSFSNESVCSAQPGCKWTGWSCTYVNCYDFKTSDVCEANACNWDSEYCLETNKNPVITKEIRGECASYNNKKDSCLEQEVCQWKPTSSIMSSSKGLPTSLWLLWMVNNIAFIGFIILVIYYGQKVGSTKIVNLGLFTFVIEVITRYIGFWFDFKGYFAFSILAILGGLMLIFGALYLPKIRKKLLSKTVPNKREGL